MDQGIGKTEFTLGIGFKTTTQLNNCLEGEALISTKAVIQLINNYKVNPLFLFLGQGDIFLSDTDEIEELKKERAEWIQRHNKVVETNMKLQKVINEMEDRNNKLIDLTHYALELEKQHKLKENSETNNTPT
ncbi:MAG: hypothetical protein HOC82_11910 [Bacteroidetes bacterium]|nr:hypothetical protein [Bacteroidota bacterium]